MAYTSHGHFISGTQDDQPAPLHKARCGGPGACRVCSAESLRVLGKAPEIHELQPSDKARALVLAEYNALYRNGPDGPKKPLTMDNIVLVWFNYTLGGWKALAIANVEDRELYFEVTYNPKARETYIDTYQKIRNIAVPDPLKL